MTIATRKDIVDVFPGLEDHAVVEILGMEATTEDLEAALAVLSSDDKDLIDVQHREGTAIHRLMNILSRAGVATTLGRDR